MCMRWMRPILFSIPLIALAMSQTGCLLAAAAAGTGAGVAYVKGKSTDLIEADPRAIADAAEKAMRDLDIAVISKAATGVDASIVGRTARDTKVDITAKAETDRTSKVFIRVGVFGDDPLQARLIERIRANLGAPAEDRTAVTSG